MLDFLRDLICPKEIKPRWNIHLIDFHDVYIVECLYDYSRYPSKCWLGSKFNGDTVFVTRMNARHFNTIEEAEEILEKEIGKLFEG